MSVATSKRRVLAALVVGLALWSGCSADSDIVDVAQVAGATQERPTETPTTQPVPTATAAPPATPTAIPTATPTPTPTVTPTPFAIKAGLAERLPGGWSPIANTELQVAPSSALPDGGVLLPADYSGSRWRYIGVLGKLGPKTRVVLREAAALATIDGVAPLTGLPAVLPDRPALIVKIDNVPAARPQTGINEADIVYEELVESGVTRFAAVYHSTTPEVIGPVRSGRSTDIGIIASFNTPVFAFSGANSIYEKLIDKQPIINRGAEVFSGYWRNGSRRAPHNLYTSSSIMLGSVEGGAPPRPHFAYRADGAPTPVSAQPASSVQLKYLTGNSPVIEYVWDDLDGTWLRSMSGRPHVDTSGVQLAPENLVVQFVDYIDTGLTDKWGEDLYEGVSVGRGSALVFTDADGNHIELTPGQTHVALIAPGGATWS